MPCPEKSSSSWGATRPTRHRTASPDFADSHGKMAKGMNAGLRLQAHFFPPCKPACLARLSTYSEYEFFFKKWVLFTGSASEQRSTWFRCMLLMSSGTRRGSVNMVVMWSTLCFLFMSITNEGSIATLGRPLPSDSWISRMSFLILGFNVTGASGMSARAFAVPVSMASLDKNSRGNLSIVKYARRFCWSPTASFSEISRW
mmetsp:Transcript_8478/g.21829  ORF Transcript_8478/g.21829 Transcript_8478/m.21829 type:complete len:201 (+) Transcript_8478:134-736(+)